ncbi:uncharacterized protein LOC130668010 [Microplitis mediator]|uniref:uncharacterized protein LOC130668010 n=1 Tax=Microplitis mediator TaxID=375433 RepID=UPI0025558CC2|nr:uncharacterized protein LOC130668010 [Microplitis mediator]
MAPVINFLTAKLIIILIINAATNADILFDLKNTADADFDGSFENVMISPNTPVYTVRSDKEKWFVLKKEFNVFRETRAYKHYNNPDNDRSNTYVVNILLILDYFEGNSQINETRYTNKILLDLDYAAKKLGELNNPKIKVHVSGVAKIKDKDFLNLPISTFNSINCYNKYSIHEKVGTWLFDSMPFIDAGYNKFIFATNERICPESNEYFSWPSHYVPKDMNCISTGETALRRGGLFYFGHAIRKVKITEMIAETFGVSCTSGIPSMFHVSLSTKASKMNPTFESDPTGWWSGCYKEEFPKIIGKSKYECYKMPAANDLGEYHESGYENLILGPNTYVYKIDFPRDNYVRVESDLNKFQATPAYNYYRNSDIDLSNTYVVNILLIYDWSLNEINSDRTHLLDSILKKLNIASENLNKLQHIKIKLRISGIAIPQRSDIFDLPTTQKVPLWDQPCYHSNRTLHYLSEWLQENKEQFENPSFDFFLFVTSRSSCGDENEIKSFDEPDIGPILTYDCNAARSLVKSSGGIVPYDPFFLKHVTQIFADRFNVRSKCSWKNGWHPIKVWKRLTCVASSRPRDWEYCENLSTQQIRSKPEYSCYKMPAFKPVAEEDDDY